VPLIVSSCIRQLTAFCLDEEGLFRVPGSTVEVQALKDAFAKGVDPLSPAPTPHPDPAAVAGVLKLYLRELSDPVMTYKLWVDGLCCCCCRL
jgi:SLIT-ROBO Rho GTPase activating protein